MDEDVFFIEDGDISLLCDFLGVKNTKNMPKTTT